MDFNFATGLELYAQEPPRKRRIAPFALSLAAHGAAVLTLLTLRFEAAPRTMAWPPQSIAVVRFTPPLAPPRPPKLPRTPSREPVRAQATVEPPVPARNVRVFQEPRAQLVERTPIAAVELPPAALEVPVNPPPTAAVRLPVLPAPPLKTGNFERAASLATAPLKGRIEFDPAAGGAGFGAAGAAAASASRLSPVTTGGFGAATVDQPAAPDPPHSSRAGFGDASVAAHAPAAITRSAEETLVEILEKPRPAYTEEARRLRIEGEVLVEILFPAAGPARVLRVLHGLGHGLDENAVAAAQSIRFRPKMRAGQAADSTAVVHIVFQIAY